MKLIDSIGISRFSKHNHLLFASNIISKAQEYSIVTERAKDEFDKLVAARDAEERVFNTKLKSTLSLEIELTDKKRDAFYNAYRKTLIGLASIPESATLEFANTLLSHLADFKFSTRLKLDKKTSVIKALVDELKGVKLDMVQALNLGHIVKSLERENNKVNDLILQRSEERKNRKNGEMRETRLATNEAYNEFVAFINSYILANKTDELDEFVLFVNAEITRCKHNVLTNRKRASVDNPDVTLSEE